MERFDQPGSSLIIFLRTTHGCGFAATTGPRAVMVIGSCSLQRNRQEKHEVGGVMSKRERERGSVSEKGK